MWIQPRSLMWIQPWSPDVNPTMEPDVNPTKEPDVNPTKELFFKSNQGAWCESNQGDRCESNQGAWCESNQGAWCEFNQGTWCDSNQGACRESNQGACCEYNQFIAILNNVFYLWPGAYEGPPTRPPPRGGKPIAHFKRKNIEKICWKKTQILDFGGSIFKAFHYLLKKSFCKFLLSFLYSSQTYKAVYKSRINCEV